MLHEQHPRHQYSGVADEQAARLENEPAIEIARRALDYLGIVVGMRRRLIVVAVRDSEAATEIDMRNGVTVGTQHAHELGEQSEGAVERIEVGNLAADVHIDAGDLEALELRSAGIDFARAADRDAELVFGLSGRDLVMRLRIDVGIDAYRDVGGAPFRRRDR